LSKESERQLVEMVGKVSLFSGLKEKQLKAIANAGKELSYADGRLIVKEGDMGVGFYLILDGKVEVRKGSKVLSKLGARQFFGEMSLVDKQPRSADVVATAPTKCYVLTAWAFSALVKSHPEIALNMMQELVARLRKTDQVSE
jgi:CRP/FNR family transcriptional regulator, cyclic AMP receptor protein